METNKLLLYLRKEGRIKIYSDTDRRKPEEVLASLFLFSLKKDLGHLLRGKNS